MTVMRERPPWVFGHLRFTQAVLERLDEEAIVAARDRDEESCGLLTGPLQDPRFVDAVVPLENRANALHRFDSEAYPRTGRTYFDVDPRMFERYVRDGSIRRQPVKVLYHSHIDVGAYFSDTDAQGALMGLEAPSYDLAYLVTSIRSLVVDDRKLFIWDAAQKAFIEVPFTST